MGGGSYSYHDREIRAKSEGYYEKPKEQIFKQRSLNNAMSPMGITVREARDSEEHPHSVPIILALDVTGSMGNIPHHLVKDGLPTIMSTIIQRGIPDPQLLFLAIGDHEHDMAPLQVGQFESSDALLDKWLTSVYLEGGGGPNAGESYFLAWYFAAHHTAIDSFEKRKQKGFLFTIGDEPTLKSIPKYTIQKIMGPGQYPDNIHALSVLEKARESYHVYHIHVKETYAGSRSEFISGWRDIMKQDLVIVEHHSDIPKKIAEIVAEQAVVDVKQRAQDVISNAKPQEKPQLKPKENNNHSNNTEIIL
jgi:hypothetical protein